MGCKPEDGCPANLDVSEDWNLDDPKDKSLSDVRCIRDKIRVRVGELVDLIHGSN